jgi:hypothetical protein
MRAYVMSLLLAGSLVFLVVAPPTPVSHDGTPIDADVVRKPPEGEVARIRAHFDTVLAELGSRDLSGLAERQRSKRALLVTTLRAYRDRGAFPKNYDFPDRAVPYFVDRRTGVHCAVGHLLEATGRTDIVDRVRRANNNVRVADLAGDTAFVSWLDASGLTLDEAARIQPTYGGGRDVDDRQEHTYRNTSAVAIPLSVLSALWNLSENASADRPAAATVGLAIGVATLGLGLFADSFPDASGELVLANGAAGGASVFVSARGLIRRNRPPKPAAALNGGAPTRAGMEASVAPAFSLVGQKSAGIAVNVRF